MNSEKRERQRNEIDGLYDRLANIDALTHVFSREDVVDQLPDFAQSALALLEREIRLALNKETQP